MDRDNPGVLEEITSVTVDALRERREVLTGMELRLVVERHRAGYLIGQVELAHQRDC
jgi:hypothetical protein